MEAQITIVQYYKSIVDGVMTSMIDLFFNLRERFDVKLMIICPEFFYLPENDFYDLSLDDTEFLTMDGEHIEWEEWDRSKENNVTTSIPFLKYNKNFGDPKLFYSIVNNVNNGTEKEEVKIGSRITICSARLLYEKLLGRLNLRFRMGTGHLFVLDSLDLYKSNKKVIPNLDIAIPKNLKNLIYFSNPANFVKGKMNIEYYHKFSKRRLDTLDLSDIVYKRGKEKTKVKDQYFENIGKGIFEHLYHGKKVDYYGDDIKDGLYYYLKLFGIDGTKDHIPLNISKEEIEDKLLMKEDDEIIKKIEEIIYENI